MRESRWVIGLVGLMVLTAGAMGETSGGVP